MIETIYGNIPSKSNSYRIIKIGNHASLGKTELLKAYEKSFYLQCVKHRNKLIGCYLKGKKNPVMTQGEVGFKAKVYYDSKRPDLDGSFKSILDCLQKVNAIKNDNMIVEIIARKYKDEKNPRIEFELYPIEGWEY